MMRIKASIGFLGFATAIFALHNLSQAQPINGSVSVEVADNALHTYKKQNLVSRLNKITSLVRADVVRNLNANNIQVSQNPTCASQACIKIRIKYSNYGITGADEFIKSRITYQMNVDTGQEPQIADVAPEDCEIQSSGVSACITKNLFCNGDKGCPWQKNLSRLINHDVATPKQSNSSMHLALRMAQNTQGGILENRARYETGNRIVGGTLVEDDRLFPFVGAIVIKRERRYVWLDKKIVDAKNSPNDTLRPGIAQELYNLLQAEKLEESLSTGMHCSGTLVSPNMVLTAAHCLYGFRASHMEFVFGNDFQSNRRVKVIGGVYHPKYTPSEQGKFDLALLFLSEPVSDIKPPTISNMNVKDKKIILVGFGNEVIGDAPPVIGRKNYLEIPVRMDDNEYVMTDVFSQNSCHGDSGGPALIKNQDGRYSLVGVTSYGDPPCAYFSMSVRPTFYSDWLQQFLR